jgi:hypothetical protein
LIRWDSNLLIQEDYIHWYNTCCSNVNKTCEELGVPWIWLLSNMWSGCTGCEKQNCLLIGSMEELASPSDPSRCRDSGWEEEMCIKLKQIKNLQSIFDISSKPYAMSSKLWNWSKTSILNVLQTINECIANKQS